MPTFQITLSEPLQRFVAGQVAVLGFNHSDQYFEHLIEEEKRKNLEEHYMMKVREALDQNEWVAEKGFWQWVNEDTRTRRNIRQKEAMS